MIAYALPEPLLVALLKERESGMGYQFARATLAHNQTIEGVVIAGGVLLPIEGGIENHAALDFSKGISPSKPEVVALNVHRNFEPRIVFLREKHARNTLVAALQTKQSNNPPHEGLTSESDVFFRVTAALPDWRRLADGSLVPNTYATTDTDITVVPSGLAAVGRYALPTRHSARYVFKIKPGAGVRILFGTVTPNYGLAGGGVEVLFPDGTPAGSSEFSHLLPEK